MHWKHSRFDVAYLILGNCHTYDEAYRVLLELEEDRKSAIDTSMAESYRAQAKVAISKTVINDSKETQVNRLNAQANILETKSRTKIAQACLDEAKRELEFINMLKDAIKPLRLFKEYEDHIAFQMIQPLEWKLDIMWQSYNQMCANSGALNSELIMLIKTHPDASQMLDTLDYMSDFIQSNGFDKFIRLSKPEVLNNITADSSTCLISNSFIHKTLQGTNALGDSSNEVC